MTVNKPRNTDFEIRFGDVANVRTLMGNNIESIYLHAISNLQYEKLFLLVDENVHNLYKPQCQAIASLAKKSLILPVVAGESCKTLANIEQIAEQLMHAGINRSSAIVGIGGGALLNLSGTITALLFRGLPLIYVPTTLMAQHDVITSLKTAVNLVNRKNNFGTYYPSTLNICDLSFFKSLPEQEWKSGLGELIKNALIIGREHYDGAVKFLSQANDRDDCQELVRLGINAKQSLLDEDPYEKKSGVIFEYGHTVGHALEKCYGSDILPHGIAVCWGMLFCSYASNRLGFLSDEAKVKHDELIRSMVGSDKLIASFPVSAVIDQILGDSKRGKLFETEEEASCVLLEDIGKPRQTPTMLSKFPMSFVYEWFAQEFADVDKASA